MLSSEERYARRLNELLWQAPGRGVAQDAARILQSVRDLHPEHVAILWGFPDRTDLLGARDVRRKTSEVAYRWAFDAVTFSRIESVAVIGAGVVTGVTSALAAMHFDPESRQLLRLPHDTVVLLAGCDHPLAGLYLPAIRVRDAGYVSFPPI